MVPRDPSADDAQAGTLPAAAGSAFRAFISYSHRDTKTAEWLHKALETYRIPRKLIGRETATGTIGKRVGRVFRDRDELEVAADLSGKINEALRQSQFLVVLCSRASAKSKWVNQEVISFKRLKGAERIIAVIVDGEPFASDIPGREDEECFVPALRYKVTQDGVLTAEPAEPIAADLRPGKDPQPKVRLKVIAGILGVGLDELIRRDSQRRQRFLTYALAASVAGLMTMGALTRSAVIARNDAQYQKAAADRQRVQAEDLIEFMLGDLRKKLQPVGRLDVLDSVGEKALGYFATLQPDELDADTLGRRARALHLIGETQNLRGNLDNARRSFTEANQTTAELLARDPDNTRRIFDHGQSVYWIGYVDWQRGDKAAAQQAFAEYQRLSVLLTAKDPGNIEWQKEAGYAYTNVGVLLFQDHRYGDAVENFRHGREIFARVAPAGSGDRALRLQYAQFDAWLADGYRALGQLDSAKSTREEELAIYREVLQGDPLNKTAAQYTVVSLFSLGRIAMEQGDTEGALGYFDDALKRSQSLAAGDTDNVRWAELEARANLELGERAQVSADNAAAQRHALKAGEIADRLLARNPTMVSWKTGVQMRARLLEAKVALGQSDSSRARRVTRDLLTGLEELHRAQPGATDIQWLAAQAHLTDGDAAAMTGAWQQSHESWSAGIDKVSPYLAAASLQEKVIFLSLLERLGRKTEAAPLANALLQMGERHPDVVRLYGRLGISR